MTFSIFYRLLKRTIKLYMCKHIILTRHWNGLLSGREIIGNGDLTGDKNMAGPIIIYYGPIHISFFFFNPPLFQKKKLTFKMATVYTQAEVEKHNTKGDIWMVIHEKVYDVSTFAEDVSSFFM